VHITVLTLGKVTMRTPGLWLVSAALAPVVLAACGDSNEPVRPAALAIAGGNGQTGPVGGTLAEPLRVILTGSDGRPFAGGTVSWAITSGSGTANPPSSATDANGVATALVTPTAAGALTITASSGSVTPAAFTASAVPPCQYVRPYNLGEVVSGTLSTLDCGLNLGAIFYYDFYQLTFAAQQSFTVTMSSAAFDTWVDLLKPTGQVVGSNDDSLAVPTNSHFEGIFAAGNYVIGASSFDPVTTGSYTVRSATRPPTIAQCRVVWGVRPVTVTDAVMATDCPDASSGSTFYSDRLALWLESGATLEAHMTSGAVDPSLYLFDLNAGVIVASNNDSTPGNPTAFLTYTAPAASVYFIDIGTATAGQTGAYTLTLSGSPIVGGTAFRLGVPVAAARGAGTKLPISIRIPLRARLVAGEGGGPK
jgi:hypothetical protein